MQKLTKAHMNYMLSFGLCILLAAVLMIAVVPNGALKAYASSGVLKYDGIYYTVGLDGNATVGRQKSAGDMFAVDDDFNDVARIPDSIVDAQGNAHRVIAVSAFAFSDGSGTAGANLTGILLSAGVKSIGDHAFTACKQMKSVAFSNGSTLESIGSFAFAQCRSLSSITIPASVTDIGEYCFYNCASLEQLDFEEPDSANPPLDFEPSVFATSGETGSLSSVTLPARTVSISTKMFQNQRMLQSVVIKASELESIGALAFENCSSLKEIRIPKLTTTGSAPIGTRAFRACDSLKTVVFLSDVDYECDASQFSSSKMLSTYYPAPLDIENIVYCGAVSSPLFPDKGNHYYGVGFYASQEAIQNGEHALSRVCIRDDVHLSSISSNILKEDEKGPVVFDGEIPVLSSSGSWFFPGHSKNETVSPSIVAYMADEHNLAVAEFVGELSYPFISEAIKPGFRLCDVNGKALQEGSDYSLQVYDKTGTLCDLESLSKVGSYELVATGMGDYAGSLVGRLQITYDPVDIERLSGDSASETSYAIASKACREDGAETVVLVSTKDKKHSMAASGLAGAFEAPIIQTNAKKLSIPAKRLLRSVKPKRVLAVGPSTLLSAAVLKEVDRILPSGSTITRLGEKDACATSAALFARTKASGTWKSGGYCIVASSSTTAGALSAGPLAYALKSPVFLVDSKKGLSSQVKSAIKSGKFKNCLIVGGASLISKTTEKALKKQVPCKRINGSNAYEISAAVSNFAASKGLLQYDEMAIASSGNYGAALSGAALCGSKRSIMLFADKTSGQSATNINKLAGNRYSMFKVFVLGDSKGVSAAVLKKLSSALIK